MSAMLDTPMADYGSDIDVFMQTHSDPWIQEDGIMDEDSFNSYNQTEVSKLNGMDPMAPIESTHTMSLSTFPALPTSKDILALEGESNAVEVEMEEYTEEPHEYEMLDDDDNHDDEIQDVEVHDVQAPEPGIGPSPQISFSHSNETTASILETTSLVTPEASFDRTNNPSIPNHDSPEGHESSLVTQDHNGPSDGIDSPVPIESHLPPYPGGEGTAVTAEDTHEALESDASGQPAQPTEVENTEVEFAKQVGGDSEISVPRVDSESKLSALAQGHDLLDSSSAVKELEPAAPEHDSQDASHDDHEATEPNPHEISEGVYIEPPPPVLIEIPSSEQTFSIFNRPSMSGRSTPSPKDSSVDEGMHVLLHDRPTLFYEPVFTVFEALRQEEPFYTSADFREAELMFEISSLKLAISEDNVYAREVSLHDLSILHDSFGEGGPLRLQLRSPGPRFILRYSELQEHLHRIHLADEQRFTVENTEDTHHGNDLHQNAKGEDIANEDPESHNDELSEDQQRYLDLLAPNVTSQLDTSESSVHDQSESDHHTGDASLEDSTGIDGQDLLESGLAANNNLEQGSDDRESTEKLQESPEHGEDGQAAHVDDVLDGQEFEFHNGDQSALEGENLDPLEEVVEEESDHFEEEDSETPTETPGDCDGGELMDSEVVEGDESEQPAAEVDTSSHAVVPGEDEQVISTSKQALDFPDHSDIDDPSEIVDTEFPVEEDASLELSDKQHEDATREKERKDDVDNEHNVAEGTHDFTELPELPDDDEFWDDELDGEGEIDASWDGEQDETISNESSVTLSSKGSKRSYSEVDGEYDNEGAQLPFLPSPDKRTRLE